MTSEQKYFLSKGAYRRISVDQHCAARRWAQRREGRWIADRILNWDGTLLPYSSNLYVGRLFVRPIKAWRGQWSADVIKHGFAKEVAR